MRNIFKILGITLMIGGWLCAGIGFTTTMPHPINTIMFVGGLIMVVIGVIMLGIIVLEVNSQPSPSKQIKKHLLHSRSVLDS
jgi:cytochrome c biogenesis protein CcdA